MCQATDYLLRNPNKTPPSVDYFSLPCLATVLLMGGERAQRSDHSLINLDFAMGYNRVTVTERGGSHY